MKKGATSFRLSGEARRLLRELAEFLGISQTAVLEILVREKAKVEFMPRRDISAIAPTSGSWMVPPSD